MNEQPPIPQIQDVERVERLIEKHEKFMELTMGQLKEFFQVKKVVDFAKLPFSAQNVLLNEFLLKTYPESQSDFRTKLKTELLKLL